MSTIKTNQLAHTANGASVYTLPTADGSAGQVLKTDGSGNLSWTTVAAPDYVKISKATSTGSHGSQYLSFENLDITTYKFFDLIGYFKPHDVDAAVFRFRYRNNSNSLVDSSVYSYAYNEKKHSNTSNCVTGEDTDKIDLTGSVGYAAYEGVYLNLRVSFADSSDPTNATALLNSLTWQATYREQGNDGRHTTGEGHAFTANNAFSGFSIYPHGGNMGDFSYCLYGMKR
tara:strand:- start:403 stop:1089 length:687 start_codon:yes stop_codon:yes gene_type:complete